MDTVLLFIPVYGGLCLRATRQRKTTVSTITQHVYTPPVFPGIGTWDFEALPFWPGARAAQETSTAHGAIVNATIVVASGWMDHGASTDPQCFRPEKQPLLEVDGWRRENHPVSHFPLFF